MRTILRFIDVPERTLRNRNLLPLCSHIHRHYTLYNRTIRYQHHRLRIGQYKAIQRSSFKSDILNIRQTNIHRR